MSFMVLLSYLQLNNKPQETEPLGAVDLVWDQTGFRIVDIDSTIGSTNVPAQARPLLFQKIPVNEADVELLQTIPGIGPELAARIVDTRKREGRFNNSEDLLKVAGIGMKRKEFLQDKLHFE
jgi:competence ComEA-like helix-hairpin-helix protein